MLARQGNARTSPGTIDLGKAVLRGERGTELMLKSRTMYPYGLNENVDICEGDKNEVYFKGYFKVTKHVDITTGKRYLFQSIKNL